jgi:dTDP-6-deoxy-L-talose 4-dehydrogenase (NAD+)
VEDHISRRGTAIKMNLGYYPYPEYEPMAFWGDGNKLNSLHVETCKIEIGNRKRPE